MLTEAAIDITMEQNTGWSNHFTRLLKNGHWDTGLDTNHSVVAVAHPDSILCLVKHRSLIPHKKNQYSSAVRNGMYY